MNVLRSPHTAPAESSSHAVGQPIGGRVCYRRRALLLSHPVPAFADDLMPRLISFCAYLFALAFVPASPVRGQAPPPPPPLVSTAATRDGPAGHARDWNRFATLFVPGARMVPTRLPPDGIPRVRLMSTDEYASIVGSQLEKTGFSEREIGRVTDAFGNIAHVLSAYESRRTAADAQPFGRGVNSFQLFFDGTRWWIVSIFWDSERPSNPIPATLLTHALRRDDSRPE